nr:PREDICTED: dynein heavy chain domain-containing protein 1-like [Apteryx mantelli mantelli]
MYTFLGTVPLYSRVTVWDIICRLEGKHRAISCACLPPGLSEDEVTSEIQRCIQQLPSPAEPASCGTVQGLQEELLAVQSRAMFSDLLRSQQVWQPCRLPASQQQEALRQFAEQGLALIAGLQQDLQMQGWEVGGRSNLPQGQSQPKPGPLHQFLLEERGSFLALLHQVERDLSCVQERLKGGVCQSPRCTAILPALQQGRLPQLWLHYAPAGPRVPSKWLETPQSRCQLLCSYLDAMGGQPVPLYHLSAFQHPRRLPLALLQEAALAEKQELDQYQLDQQVLPSLLPPAAPPGTGLFLTGLEVRDAMRDIRSAALRDACSAQPCLLPPVWIRAVQKEKPSAAHSTAPSQTRYCCPVFLGQLHEPARLASHRAVLHVVLPCESSPALCAQRRVHVVSRLPCPK